MKSAALFAVVAILCFAALECQAIVGHTSCYETAAACTVKPQILKACAAKTVGLATIPTPPGTTTTDIYGCPCFVYYTFANTADHDDYQNCEKTGAGKTLYDSITSKDLPEGISKVVTY